MTAQHHGRRGRPWRRIRLQILARDPWCQIRGPKCTGMSTTVDHIVPLSIRPDLAHVLSNLRGACGPCNYGRGGSMTGRYGTSRPHGSPDLAPSGQPWRLSYQGIDGCPVSNHGTICMGGHRIDPVDWRPEYEARSTWPDGEFAPGEGAA